MHNEHMTTNNTVSRVDAFYDTPKCKRVAQSMLPHARAFLAAQGKKPDSEGYRPGSYLADLWVAAKSFAFAAVRGDRDHYDAVMDLYDSGQYAAAEYADACARGTLPSQEG